MTDETNGATPAENTQGETSAAQPPQAIETATEAAPVSDTVPDNGEKYITDDRGFGRELRFNVGVAYPDIGEAAQLDLLQTHRGFAKSLGLDQGRANDLFDAIVQSEKEYERLKDTPDELDRVDWNETDKLLNIYTSQELDAHLEDARQLLHSTPEGRKLLDRGAFRTRASVGRLIMYVKRMKMMQGQGA